MKKLRLKSFLSMVLSLALLVCCMPIGAVAAEVPEGYTPVCTIQDLYQVRNNLAADYILMNDIDMTEATAPGGNWDDGRGWTPIGDEFTGIFDGNGYTITGMNIHVQSLPAGSPVNYYSGLFAKNSGTIKDLKLKGGSVDIGLSTNNVYFGMVTGLNSGNIENCSNSGKITVSNAVFELNKTCSFYISGIAGCNTKNIVRASNTGNITSTSAATNENSVSFVYTGGVAGYNSGSITGSANTGGLTVLSNSSGANSGNASTSMTYTGGITGYNTSSVIADCNAGNIISKLFSNGVTSRQVCNPYSGNCWYVSVYTECNACNGGIAGYTSGASLIEDVFNCGGIKCTRDTGDSGIGKAYTYNGGITGYNFNDNSVFNRVYNIGPVPSIIGCNSNFRGGIIGYCSSNPVITSCYFKNNITQGVGFGNDPCLSRTDAQLRIQETFQGYDFTNTWFMNSTDVYPYPQLRCIVIPEKPNGFACFGKTDSTVTLVWNAVSGATGYNVYNGITLVNAAPLTDTAYTVTGLTQNTAYSFTVKAVNAGGESEASSPLDVTTVITAPTGLTSPSKTDTTVALSWNAVEGATGYNVYNGTTLVNAEPLTDTACTVTDLTQNTAYSFTVKAVNAGGESAASSPLEVTTNATAPAAPTVLASLGKTDTTVVLTWDAAERATGYNVYNGLTLVNAAPITGTTYTVTHLAQNTAYSFTVKAVNSGGESAASPPLSVATRVTISLTITSGNAVIDGTFYMKVGLFTDYRKLTIPLGYTASLSAADIAKVEWVSDNARITVDQTGKCTPTVNRKCTANITVKITDTDGNVYEKTVLVKVYKFFWDKYLTNY